tara:strand:+ start:12099 stop:12815 length:717 start_codon:yes stop_codon:yes gene_type:complete
MADIYSELDNLSEQFVAKVIQAKDEVTEALYTAMKDMSQEERMVLLAQIDVDDIMSGKLKDASLIYETGIIRILETTYTTAQLSETTLLSLTSQVRNKINKEVLGKLTDEILDKITTGIATRSTVGEIVAGIETGMTRHQMEVLVNTTLTQFNNTITNLSAELLPDSTKFIYIGAHDEKTRDRCIEKIKMSPATKGEILKKYGNLDNELWNCRHKWEEMSDDPESQGLDKIKDTSVVR